jgi:hypothetical protein
MRATKSTYYYHYDFVSPAPLFALIKEELKSYYDAGAIDDLLWPIYLEKCLKKLRRGSYKINPLLLEIKDFEARLPDDFYAVREAWMCTSCTTSYQLPSAQYQAVAISTRLDSPDLYCDLCTECQFPDTIRALYKTTNTVLFEFRKQYLLKPGNISVEQNCTLNCANTPTSDCMDTFDVRGNKFVTNFREGVVHLIYYAKEYDESGYQLIPDSYDIWEYVEAFIKYKAFEQLSNQASDETYNQLQQKCQLYDQKQQEKFILARTETMKETVYQIQKAIRRNDNRLNKFILS